MSLDIEDDKIPIGISSCLLGEEVRYDGGHKYNPTIINTLGQYFSFIPFCPEVDVGLGVPREPINLVVLGDQIRCVDVKTGTHDVTDRLIECADQQQGWQRRIYGYILKQRSPSCGTQGVKLWRAGIMEPTAVGIYANRLMQNFPHLPLEDEGHLEDKAVRDGFIQRVRIYHRQCTST